MKVIEQIILASQSEIRKSLLASFSLHFSTQPSKIDESLISDSNPKILASLRAAKKAEDVARRSSLSLVIGCDQVLSFRDQVFSKPKSEAEAFAQIQRLQGGSHYLLSAVSVFLSGALEEEGSELFSFVSPVEMKMKALTEKKIKDYVATGEWQGSVGAYKIEGQGAHLFSSFPEGFDKTIIMGLPMEKFIKELKKFGLDLTKKVQLPFELM